MNSFLLGIDVDASKPVEGVTDKLFYGGQMLIIGMLTVFLVLGIIWLALTLLKFFFVKSASNAKTPAVAPVPSVPTVATDNSLNGEIVAAIACAIALAESENEGTKFRVVSFKKR